MAKSQIKKAREMFHKNERRRSLILLVREHPDWTHQQLANHLKCDRTTVCRDLAEITADMQKMNSEAFLVHFQRILMEFQANKMMCLEMIKASQKKDKEGNVQFNGKGSRWLEEYTKIQMAEMKLLGLDKFDPNLTKDAKPFDKAQQDAAVDAALKGIEAGVQVGLDISKILVKNIDAETSSPPAPADPAPPVECIESENGGI